MDRLLNYSTKGAARSAPALPIHTVARSASMRGDGRALPREARR